MALSEAKKRANKKWNDANREKQKVYTKKSNTKTYIQMADAEMLEEVKTWISDREKELNN